jgi:hypothetical protein
MARRRQSSGSFNLSGFDAVDVGVDLGVDADVDRVEAAQVEAAGGLPSACHGGDAATAGVSYRRAAGWAVDETAKAAVLGIRAGFHKTLKRQTPSLRPRGLALEGLVEARADPKDGCLRGLVDGPPGGPPWHADGNPPAAST